MYRSIIHRRFFTSLIFALSIIYSRAQEKIDSSKIYHLYELKTWCIDNYNLDFDRYFYANWAKYEGPAIFLYVSKKDSISEVSFQNISYTDIWELKDIMDSFGHHTLIYKTYGTATTLLTKNLLNYPLESLSFIALHEATHQHIRNNTKIPKILEEAICDVVGNYGSLEIANNSELLDSHRVTNHINKIELFAEEINNCLNQFETKKLYQFSSLKKLIDSLTTNAANSFLNDRYNYPINNAYFIRYRDYTKFYFLVKELVFKMASLRDFFDFIIRLPNDEKECLKRIKQEIKNS